MNQPHPGGHEHLSGAWNFRDIAGVTGVRPGRFFRSSELSHLDESGRTAMSRLAISDVADLRSHVELERRGPGAVPEGVVVHHLPFPDLSHAHAEDGAAPHETSWQKMMTEYSDEEPSVAAGRWMTQEYERFPTLGGAQRAVRLIITMLGEGRPVLVHCFAGKDRTGFAVAVALEAAGIEREAILRDYLLSNTAVSRLRERILDSMRRRDGMTPEVVSFAESRLTEEVLGVRKEYLDSARRVLEATYGGLPGYLAAAGVAADDIDRMRRQLLD